jgi:predicted 3-demethylubiquinone-9 3-methyltransferase (glyoxalase superfamily)
MALFKQKITPFLWFDKEAEAAARHYTAIFKNSKLGAIARYPEGTPGQAGSVMTVQFELEGLSFTALNAGPMFKFTEAISFVVHCQSQAEVDHFWDKLSAGGNVQQCGWLKDKFGLSWQIVPDALIELTTGKDAARSQRVFAAMMKMVKIDIAALEKAAAGG